MVMGGGKVAALACFVCGEDVRGKEGHGSLPWICREDIEKLMMRWSELFGVCVADSEGVVVGWEMARGILEAAQRDSALRVTRILIEVPDRERVAW